MYQVIIVEDDPMVAEIDKQYVEHNSKMAIAGIFQNGQEALDFVRTHPVDLIMLDYYMPVMDGRTFLVKLRAEGILADVIMVTAASEARHVSELYSYGVSDYLIKPFDLEELSARIRALLRRSAGRADPLITRGRLTINPSTREVTFDGKPVILSAKEYALLEALAERKGLVLSRAQLESKLYNWDSTVGSNAIEVHIHHLRKKLSEDAIKTVRGMGYILET